MPRTPFIPPSSKYHTTLFKVPHRHLQSTLHPLQSTTTPSSKYYITLFKVPHNPLQSTTFIRVFAYIRWEVVLAPSDGHFQQVSFVNSIATTKGGTHVTHVTDQICKHIAAYIEKVCICRRVKGELVVVV